MQSKHAAVYLLWKIINPIKYQGRAEWKRENWEINNNLTYSCIFSWSLCLYFLFPIFPISIGLFPNFLKHFSKLHVSNYHFLPHASFWVMSLCQHPWPAFTFQVTVIWLTSCCSTVFPLRSTRWRVNCPLSVNVIFLRNSVFANVVK